MRCTESPSLRLAGRSPAAMGDRRKPGDAGCSVGRDKIGLKTIMAPAFWRTIYSGSSVGQWMIEDIQVKWLKYSRMPDLNDRFERRP